MCNFGEAVEYYAEQRGFERGILFVLRNLQETTGWSLQQAMDGMKLSPEDQEKYSKMLRAEA